MERSLTRRNVGEDQVSCLPIDSNWKWMVVGSVDIGVRREGALKRRDELIADKQRREGLHVQRLIRWKL